MLLLEIYLVDPSNIRPPVFIPEGHTVSFGRNETADICCDFDERISRKHFEVENNGDSAQVRDLNSTSGTHLNGLHVGEAKLRNGDTIRAGITIFGVRILELAPEGVPSEPALS